MNEFVPGTYRDLYETELGRNIWGFLNGTPQVQAMMTATFLNRPAVEALSPMLVFAFGDVVKVDRIKRMIGTMVRQILEQRGYRLDTSGVHTHWKRNGSIFKSGSRYKAA